MEFQHIWPSDFFNFIFYCKIFITKFTTLVIFFFLVPFIVLSTFTLLWNQLPGLSLCKTKILYSLNKISQSSCLPSCEPAFYCLSLWIWLFYILYISGIIQCLSFVTGLLHLEKYPQRSSMYHVLEFPSFLNLNSILVYVYTIFW